MIFLVFSSLSSLIIFFKVIASKRGKERKRRKPLRVRNSIGGGSFFSFYLFLPRKERLYPRGLLWREKKNGWDLEEERFYYSSSYWRF